MSASRSSVSTLPRTNSGAPERYVSLSVAAEHFSVSEKTLRKFIAARQIPARRLGRQIRLKLSEVEHSMEAMGNAERYSRP